MTKRFYLIHTSLATFLLGILGASQVAEGKLLLPFGALLLLLPLTWWLRRFWPAILALSFALGFCYTQTWRWWYYTNFPLHTSLDLIVRIVAPPDQRTTVTLLTVQPWPSHGRGNILVHTQSAQIFHYGELLSLKGELDTPASFDHVNYPLLMERYHVYAIMTQPESLRPSGTSPPTWFTPLDILHGWWESHLQANLPEPIASFVGGVLLGSKHSISADLQTALQQTGTSHIVAISGANITIMLDLLNLVLPLYSLRARWWATVITAVFLTLLTGASASVLRGSMVAVLGGWLKMRSRKAWATPLLLCSASLLLLANPLLLVADAGFQLSFAAFAGLTYLSEPIKHFMNRWWWFQKLPELMRQSAEETLAASLATLPISCTIFGYFSWLGLLVNPLILWLLPLLTVLGILTMLIGSIPIVGTLCTIFTWLIANTIVQTILWFSHLPFGTAHINLVWPVTIILTALLCLIMLRSKLPTWPTQRISAA